MPFVIGPGSVAAPEIKVVKMIIHIVGADGGLQPLQPIFVSIDLLTSVGDIPIVRRQRYGHGDQRFLP